MIKLSACVIVYHTAITHIEQEHAYEKEIEILG